MQDSESDDRNLIDRVARGDHTAFEALVRRHGPAVRRFARALTDDASADDVTQDAMLDAFRGAGGYRGESSVRSWLFTLARNRAFHHRSAARRREVSDTPLIELGVAAGCGQNPEALVAVRAHVSGCSACERFGGACAAVVKALRKTPGGGAARGVRGVVDRGGRGALKGAHGVSGSRSRRRGPSHRATCASW